jgi:hypothetical protein
MSTPYSPFEFPRVRNTHTQAIIQRETFWQVFLPFGVALLLVIVVMVLTIAGTVAPARTSALADVSLMFLIMLSGMIGLVALALLAGLAFGLYFLIREVPYWLKRVQDFFWIVAGHARAATRRVDDRIVGVHISYATVHSVVTSFRDIFVPRRVK